MSLRRLSGAACLVGLLGAFACGCAFERHYGIVPGENQVIEVTSGDRWPFDLEESPGQGEWTCVCDDDDVEVTVDHVPGKARVVIRIHRGYDGPSVVTFRRRKAGSGPSQTFSVTLYKRTGDEAFWK